MAAGAVKKLRRSTYFFFGAVAMVASSISLMALGCLPQSLGVPWVIGGGLMLIDWSYGIQTFPRLLSLPRTAEEDDLPEQMLYSGPLVMQRCGMIAAFVVVLAIAYLTVVRGAWEVWTMLSGVGLYVGVLLIHSRSAIELAAQKLREND